MMQKLVGGKERVRVEGTTVRQVVNNLEKEYPGVKDRLCVEDEIMPGLAVIVDGEVTSMGMMERIQENSEIHFLPAIGGGVG